MFYPRWKWYLTLEDLLHDLAIWKIIQRDDRSWGQDDALLRLPRCLWYVSQNITYANMKFWYGLVVYSGRIMFCLSACLLRSFTSLLPIFDCRKTTALRCSVMASILWAFKPPTSWIMVFWALAHPKPRGWTKNGWPPGLLQQELFLLKTSMFRFNLSLQGFLTNVLSI